MYRGPIPVIGGDKKDIMVLCGLALVITVLLGVGVNLATQILLSGNPRGKGTQRLHDLYKGRESDFDFVGSTRLMLIFRLRGIGRLGTEVDTATAKRHT